MMQVCCSSIKAFSCWIC